MQPNSRIYTDIIKTAQLQDTKVELLDNLLFPGKYSSMLSPASGSGYSKYYDNQYDRVFN
jgi:hypothetical protein